MDSVRSASNAYTPSGRHGSTRVFSLIQLLFASLLHLVYVTAAPLVSPTVEEAAPANDPQKWVLLGIAIALVLLGGAFAGLTIALMGQDEVYLQVIAVSGEGVEKRNAAKVLTLLKRGKHWVLVTLLVGNVITNETLPIVLDRSIGGGYAAAISSTVLVIIFGEIVPQSICVRFGLPIGAWMADFVLILMWVFAPITWPIAKLLDRLLGEDHGTTYKKAGLKTLVTLHKTMGEAGADRLNEDEVSIISGVLDLKAKSVGSIMTPMDDVFVLSADAVLDEGMMDKVMREGYSRIPIHEPKSRTNFVGMLLVKMLITYDPQDALRVRDFSLATLPETDPRTSCLDIINFFQEGKSHMVLVSDSPGENQGALGVVTLEDVIEELIGEEIIDESDVFVDVHKAIRRMTPAPTHRHRLQSKNSTSEVNRCDDFPVHSQDGKEENEPDSDLVQKRPSVSVSDSGRSPQAADFIHRKGSIGSAVVNQGRPHLPGRHYTSTQMKQQFKHLGPSNAARQPKSTRVNTVKIKPGVGTIPEVAPFTNDVDSSPARPVHTPPPSAAQAGIGQDLVSPGKDASDGVQAVHQSYGSFDPTSQPRGRSEDDVEITAIRGSAEHSGMESRHRGERTRSRSNANSSKSHSTVGSMHDMRSHSRHKQKRGTARSGSITESFVQTGGIKKMVLEATSSSDDGPSDEQDSRKTSGDDLGSGENTGRSYHKKSGDEADSRAIADNTANGSHSQQPSTAAAKRKRRKKKKSPRAEQDTLDENTPLLERDV